MNINDAQLATVIQLDLIHNQLYMKKLVKDLLDQKAELFKKEDPAFHEDIKKEFNELAKQRIMEDLSKRLNLSPESISMVCEGMNLEEYLHG